MVKAVSLAFLVLLPPDPLTKPRNAAAWDHSHAIAMMVCFAATAEIK